MGKRIRVPMKRKDDATGIVGGSRPRPPSFSSFDSLLEHCAYKPVSPFPCGRTCVRPKPPSSSSAVSVCSSSSATYFITRGKGNQAQSNNIPAKVRKRKAENDNARGKGNYRNKNIGANSVRIVTVEAITALHGEPSLPPTGQKISGKQVSRGNLLRKGKRVRSRQLKKAEKRIKAYKYVRSDHPWVPPPSPYQLLQEIHHRDHWRVLVICVLCNRTSGRQVKKLLPEFFNLCQSANVTLYIPTEAIEEKIRTLGLQRERANTIKRLSEAYLKEWSYVTELPGIGKYAADAYAIFCSGYWKSVTPIDHKLVEYWKFLHAQYGLPEPQVTGFC